MVNKDLFTTFPGPFMPGAAGRNAAGAPAYEYAAQHKLAQIACTGTFADRFYQSATQELTDLLAAAHLVDPAFVAQVAIHAHEVGHMKDMPTVLLAVLSTRDTALFGRIFPRIVTSGSMLRRFAQVVRSGLIGRKSFGTRPKLAIQAWLNAATDRQLLAASVGASPSLADVVRMVHPRPETPAREALYAWLIGRPAMVSALPEVVRDLLAFRAGTSDRVPDVPFQLLTTLALTGAQWGEIARNASWQTLRQGLNMLHRKGAFHDPAVVAHVAATLRDPERVRAGRAMPYQLLASLKALDARIDPAVRDALHDAMELSVSTVPCLTGSIALCPDVSASMRSPLTGYRRGATSTVRCIDVAALVTAAIRHGNPDALVLPFDETVRDVALEARDTILTNAERLAALNGGGTDCAAPLAMLNERHLAPDLVVLISDNQSWIGAQGENQPTKVMKEWALIRNRNPRACLVCVDLQPYGSSQALSRPDILNIGGFADAVFGQIGAFAEGRMTPEHWVGQIMATPP